MALPDLRGKTKKDLAAIAHISGLLRPSDTSRMTKQQLLDYLLSVANDSEEAVVASNVEPEAAESKKRASKKTEKIAVPETTKDAEKVKSSVNESESEKEKAPEKESSARKTSTATRKTRTIKAKKTEDEEDKNTDTKTIREVKKTTSKKKSGRTESAEVADEEVFEEDVVAEVTPVAEVKRRDLVALESEEDNGEEDEKGDERSQEIATGVLEVMPEGYGFLRVENYIQSSRDIYVPPQYIRRFNLRTGDLVTGPVRHQRDNDRYKALFYVREVNGETPDKMIRRPHFDRLTPIYPRERYTLETNREELSTRIIDLVCPIGKGQRGMIVSPPKAGKTILLQKIANSISLNNPETELIVLLIDERPEEVTDMQRSIKGEVVYSTFDKTPENHVRITELVLERAMRLVELGKDVVILLDSITRMGRAYNLTINPTGRTLSGGLDPGALYGPKRFFGAARNIENGGSLTIIATALIETGSRMDEVIFEEFKGTGNMEVILDRKLADKRVFPAIDITRSGTRREELLLSEKELDAIWLLRKTFTQLETAAVTETMLGLLLKTRSNDQFISSINVSLADKSLFDAMRGGMPKRD
ncbi:MAG: transcription termination factor Rho [Saccharofermentanales bacterium]|jgi:transcription termination factor Rho|nr:transcription termination factor Rho [Clostridia bacterium]MBP6950478.1 transcription termination factor Rho [Clostridia bacterium]